MAPLEHSHENGTDRWLSERGSLRMGLAAPRVLLTHVEGHFDVELARVFLAYCDRWVSIWRQANGRVMNGFHDWSRATGYDTESRRLFTRWVEENAHKFRGIIIYTPSRIVRMGIATAKLVLGSSIDTVATRQALEQRIAEAVKQSL